MNFTWAFLIGTIPLLVLLENSIFKLNFFIDSSIYFRIGVFREPELQGDVDSLFLFWEFDLFREILKRLEGWILLMKALHEMGWKQQVDKKIPIKWPLSFVINWGKAKLALGNKFQESLNIKLSVENRTLRPKGSLHVHFDDGDGSRKKPFFSSLITQTFRHRSKMWMMSNKIGRMR